MKSHSSSINSSNPKSYTSYHEKESETEESRQVEINNFNRSLNKEDGLLVIPENIYETNQSKFLFLSLN